MSEFLFIKNICFIQWNANEYQTKSVPLCIIPQNTEETRTGEPAFPELGLLSGRVTG
jgi:hypothetical protein